MMSIRSLLIIVAALLCSCHDTSDLSPIEAGGELVMLTRNTPTSYYFEGDNEAGLDYALVRAFAEQHGMTLRVKVAFSLPELFAMLARGEGHIAASGLTQSAQRDKTFQASVPYLQQQALVAYKSGKLRPRSLAQLIGRDLVVVAGSAHNELLESLQTELPELSWREIHTVDSLELMQLVTEEKAELAVVNSLALSVEQRLFPRVVAGLEVGEPSPVVWYLSQPSDDAVLLKLVNQFIQQAHQNGDITKLKRQYFGPYKNASRVESLTFQRKIATDLPPWQPLIQRVALEYQMDWQLLAAMAYQESHWNPKARSTTGVTGMMMLTRITAEELGVQDRTNAQQSLRGGARFFKNLLRRLPPDIEEPDRTYMALAAYNIGMGHLEDARIMAQQAGNDPHLWPDVRAQLPLLQHPEVFRMTKFGFADGPQAVTYVDNIRHYEGMLKLQSLPEDRIAPPIDVGTLLPESLRAITLPVL